MNHDVEQAAIANIVSEIASRRKAAQAKSDNQRKLYRAGLLTVSSIEPSTVEWWDGFGKAVAQCAEAPFPICAIQNHLTDKRLRYVKPASVRTVVNEAYRVWLDEAERMVRAIAPAA